MIDATIEFANEDEDILNENVKDLIQKIIKQMKYHQTYLASYPKLSVLFDRYLSLL